MGMGVDSINPKYKTFTDLSKDEQDALRLSVVEEYLKKQNNVDYHKLYGVGCYVQYVSSSLLEPTEVLPQR